MSSEQDRLNRRAERDYSPAPPEKPAAPPGKSPGTILREAREDAGVSIDALSAETMIQPHILEGLEADNYAQLGQPVFVRGYYRKCARLLGISEEEISQAYTRASGVSPDAKPTVTADVTMRTTTALQAQLVRFAPTVLLVLLVAVILLVWQQFGSGDSESAPDNDSTQVTYTPEDESNPAGLFDEDNLDEPLGGNPKLSAGTKALPPNRPGAAVDTSGSIVAERRPATTKLISGIPAGAPPPSTAEAAPLLRLVFKDRSWVRVRDANGQPHLNGIIEANSERVIDEGRPPFSIILGFAPGVSIFLRGEPVPMEQHIQRDSTARFSIGAETTP